MDKTLVDPNRLCMGCMELLENTSVPCPKCGGVVQVRKTKRKRPLKCLR